MKGRKKKTDKDNETTTRQYKELKNYKKLKKQNNEFTRKLDKLLEDNIWNLKGSFQKLKEYYEELGQETIISWEEGVQNLDYQDYPVMKERSLDKLKNGEYKGDDTNKTVNSNKTERLYGTRIEFFAKTFEAFKKHEGNDNMGWVVTRNIELIYEIMRYNNDEKNSLATLSNDLKAVIRVIRLLLGEKDELRYKVSVLQNAILDLEKMGDDLNIIRTKHENVTFVPYEQLLIICDELEAEYKRGIDELNEEDRQNGKRHGIRLFKLHEILLAFALNIWNYPSRSENYTLDIIKEEKEAEVGKNYIIISENECKVIYNQEIKDHDAIKYIIKSSAIEGLNKRLCTLLNYSMKMYPREHLFVRPDYWMLNKMNKVKHTTVSSWIRNFIPKKNIGIDTFRSAFVSYYYPKFNNQQKNVLKMRMRTSTDLLLRSYLKVYEDPEMLKKIKIEPVDDNEVTEATIMNIQGVKDIKQNRKENFKRWYEDEENKKKIKEKQRDPTTYARRYIRELNSGKMDYDKLTDETKEKYKIRRNEEGIFYIDK
jgi:hypothetical protein